MKSWIWTDISHELELELQDNGFAVRHDEMDHEEHLDGQGSQVTRSLVGETEGFVERAPERKHSEAQQ